MEATIQHIEHELKGLYPKTEVQAITRLILEHVCRMNYTEQVLSREKKLDTHSREKIYKIVERLKNFEPVQYILGETEFSGLKLQVMPSVLIPRPETEELVMWVAGTEFPSNPSLLDIGTGSGCIALALKKQFQPATVAGVDISEKALETARNNAKLNGLEVHFFQADILNWEKTKWKTVDGIVSNPPYVRESEKKAMFSNVLKYEPGKALFVPDSNPLLFYRRIAEFARVFLRENGWLFFEINEKLGDDMKHLMKEFGFRNTEVKKDLNGKNRMLRCRK